MRVTPDAERTRKNVASRNHHLVPDPTTGGIEGDALIGRKGLDLRVLGQVLLAAVLDVVVQGEDGLAGIVQPPA